MLKKNRRKIQLYGLLLYFLCIGVPLYAQTEAPATHGPDSLTYQIPVRQTPPDALRSFEGVPEQYNTADFDYSDTSGQNDAFLSGFWEVLVRIIYKILEFIYGKNLQGNGAQHMLQLLGFVLVLVVIFFVVRWALGRKGRWLTDRSKEKLSDIPMDAIEKHLHQADFPTLIQKAEQQNDTRQSIRLYYLWLLKVLSDKGQIAWEERKTNSDYEREIKDPTQKARFVYLSKVYNYIWYGEFSISDVQYQEAKADYQGYINTQKKK